MLIINEELRDLIPSLTNEEYRGLEKSIIEDGCLNPIIVWDNVVVDGHNRFEICQQHGVAFNILEKQFADMNAVKAFMIEHQLSRRNINLAQRAQLALKLKPVLAEQAKKRQGERTDLNIVENSTQCSRTRDELAKRADVSSNTISRVEKVNATAAPEIIEKMNKGEISINAALKTTLPPKEPEPLGEPEPENFEPSTVELLEDAYKEIDRLTAIVEADDKLEVLNKQILVLTKTNEALTSNISQLNSERAAMIRQINFWRGKVEKQALPPDEVGFQFEEF
jgi:transcriptional regulator with XRE-family HTH domain